MASGNDGVDGAPNGINVPRWSLSSTHLKGSRPWASLSGIWLLSRELVSIWRRGCFRFMRSMRRAIIVARKLTRSQLIPFFATLPPCVVAMEACSSAHHWGRALIELGHEVRLLPPAHVKPYVRRNKSDQVDAAAICEAAGRPGQRFVPVRSIDNQAELMRHRARELLAGQRTAALNALRGHLAEIGVVAPQGAQHAYDLKRMAADGFDDNGEIVVPDCVRVALRPLVGQIDALDEAI